MIDKLNKSDFTGAGRILIVNEKAGEFANALSKKFGKKILEKCLIVPSSMAGRNLTLKFLKSLNILNNKSTKEVIDHYIMPLEDYDGNGRIDVKDLLVMSDKDILAQNNGKKFDVCLMNPPYDHGLGDKFLQKTIKTAKKVISVQPINFILGNKKNVNLIERLKNLYVSIEKNEHIQKIFLTVGATIGGDTSILYIDSTKNKSFLINDKEIDATKIDDIRHYSGDKLIEKFNNLIKELYKKDNIVNHYKNFEANEYSDDNDYCIKIPKIRGHKYNGLDSDFYTIISNSDKFVNENTIGKFIDLKTTKGKRSSFSYYIPFKTEKELSNFINYLKTDFCRAALYLLKTSPNVTSGRICRCIPWFDFTDSHFSKSPKEIDDWLFKKYNISDDIRKHIEEILPDYYNIR